MRLLDLFSGAGGGGRWGIILPVLMLPQCNHLNPVITVTGHCGGTRMRDGRRQYTKAERAEAMGIDWMTAAELSQAIPPAYTKFLGKHILQTIRRENHEAII